MKTLAQQLLDATVPDDIAAALAQFLWHEDHNELCPAKRIPTESDLADPPELWSVPDADKALRRVMDKRWEWAANSTMVATGKVIHKLFAIRFKSRGKIHAEDLSHVHGLWVEMKAPRPRPHPIEPIIRAWWDANPVEVDVDRKPNGILPGSLKRARQGLLFETIPEQLDRITPLGTLPAEPVQGFLPTLEPPKSIVPELPMPVYDMVRHQRLDMGQGAIMAQRLLFELMMAAYVQDRGLLVARLRDVTLADLVGWLWPNGWQRGRDLPKLRRALVELDNTRIAWERFDRRLIAVDNLPRHDAKLHDRIPFRLAFLPGSDHGPLIDRPQLRQFGVQSAQAWRSYLRMAYIWDAAKAANGGFRIYATRPAVKRGRDGVLLDAEGKPIFKKNGQPLTDWSDPRAVRLYGADGELLQERNPQADRVPVLDLNDLARLGFDHANVDKDTRKKRWQRTQHELSKMERQKAIVLEKDKGGWRILEPWQKEC